MKKFTRKVKKAFTLIELVVVIAVIAILSAVSVGTYFGVMNNAKKSALEQEADQLRTALRTETVTTYTDANNTFSATLVTDGILFKDLTSPTAKALPAANEATWGTKYFISIFNSFSEEATTSNTTLPGGHKVSSVKFSATDSNPADGTVIVESFVYESSADTNLKTKDIYII